MPKPLNPHKNEGSLVGGGRGPRPPLAALPAALFGCNTPPPPPDVLEEPQKLSEADQSAAPTEEHHGGNGTRLAQEDTSDTFFFFLSPRNGSRPAGPGTRDDG